MSGLREIEMVLMGTGTSHGIPMIGCECGVCQSSDSRNHRTRTGVLVRAPEGDFLIDTPPELRMQLIREKVELVHAAIYTHSHADHIFGMDDLRIFGYRLEKEIPLYCEESVERLLAGAFPYAFSPPCPTLHQGAVPKLKFERIGLQPFDLLGIVVQPIRLLHGKMPVLGFRVGNVAFCTDVSEIPEESWELLEGLDVLVLGALRREEHPTHFNVEQALEVVERLQPRQTYFTHICHDLEYHTTNQSLPQNVELAYDGLRIAVTL